jgi:N-acetylglucosamine-6-sulfatase
MNQPTERRNFLKSLGLLAGSFYMGTFACQSDQKKAGALPNIIFILVDDMRWDQLGITGHPFAKTPNIDRIGREGVVFPNAFVCTPLCSPSRASYLTGQYPHTHRIINNDRNGLDFTSHRLVTFPQVLRRAGYETAFIGKWHMGGDDTRRPGFDYWTSFRGQGHFIDPVINVNGTRKQYTGYMTDVLNNMAVDYIKQKHTKPFMLYLSQKAVHAPFIPAKRHQTLYADEKYTPPPSASDDLEGKPSLRRKGDTVNKLRIPGATPEPAEPRYGRSDDRNEIFLDHLRCLASVDDGVGMIFDSLEKSGELDNTLIIFASDNGFLFGEHGQFRNKRVAYDESIRIPLLMRYPKLIKAGSKREQLVMNLDIAPTILDIADTRSPVPVHGKSLLPVLENKDEFLRDAFLTEYFLEKITPQHASWQAVRTKKWKYIHFFKLDGMDELYDLENDPYEMKNLVSSLAHQNVLEEMKRKMRQLLQESDTPHYLINV